MSRTVLARIGGLLLPENRTGRTLAVSAGIDSLGTGLFFSSLTLYFVGVVGIPAKQVALAITAAGVIGLFAPVPLGRLADRVGVGPFYVVLLVVRGAGRTCYAFVDGLAGFVLLTVFLTAADWASVPIKQAVVTSVIGGRERTRTMASVRAVRNIGLTVGFLLAGVLFATGHKAAFMAIFLVNGVTFGIVALMVHRVLRSTDAVVVQVRDRQGEQDTGTAPATVRSPFRDRWFMLFTLSNGVLSLYDTVLVILLPVWVLEYTDVPPAWVPVLLAVNTVLTVLLQVYVSRFAEGPAAAMRLLAPAGLLLMACCAVFAAGQVSEGAVAVAVVVGAVVLLSIAENLHQVAVWELSAELSPPAARARYLGAFSLSMSGQKMAGPTLLVVLLMPAGLIAWPMLAGAFGLTTVLARTAARRGLAGRALPATGVPSGEPQPAAPQQTP